MTRGCLAVVCTAFPGGMRCRPYNYGEAGGAAQRRASTCFPGESRPDTYGETGLSSSLRHLMPWGFPSSSSLRHLMTQGPLFP